MASCKTYDQKPLVNGRGLSLGSMHDLIGSKFSSLINSDLTWKKVAKGNRTSSKSVSRSWNAAEKMIKTDSTTMDMPFSDSEKIGVSVLGCRFSENTDHVPIKKRKLMFRSPSPPPRATSQLLEENKRLTKRQPEAIDCATSASDLGQTVDTEEDISEKNLERVSKHLNEKEDFSGIHILAVAACRDSCGEVDDHVEDVSAVEESYVHEDPSMESQLYPSSKIVVKEDHSSAEISIQGTGSCNFAVLAEEILLRTHNSSIEGILQGKDAHDKSMRDCSVAVSEDLLTKKVEGADRVHGFSSPGDCSFWNLNSLNASTDTWSCSFHNHCVNSNIADGIPDYVNCGNYSNTAGSSESWTTKREPRGIRCHAEMKSLLPADPGERVYKEHFSNTKELKLDVWTDIDRTSCSLEKFSSSGHVDFVSTDSATASMDRDKSASTQSLSPHQVEGLNSYIGNSYPSKSNQSLGTCISKTISPAPSTGITCAKNEDGCVGITCENFSSSLLVEEVDVAPCMASLVNTTCGMLDVSEDAKGAEENSLFQNELGFLPSSKGVDMLTLGAIAQDSKVQRDNVFEHNENENVTHKGSEGPVTKSSEMSTAVLHPPSDAYHNHWKDSMSTFDKIPIEEPSDNGYNSEFSHDINACGKVSRFDVDYDSQYEDGEVRESIEHNWQDYDGENIEDEQADMINLGSGAEQIMTNTQAMGFQTCSSRFKGKDAKDVAKIIDNTYSKSEVGADMEISDGRIGTGKDDRRIGKRNDSGWRNIHSDDQTKLTESRTSRRESWSRTAEKAFYDVSFKKDRGRYSQHPHARGQGGDRTVDSRDSSRSIKEHHSLKYHGSMSFNHLGPAKGLDRPIRSRSPRDETLGMRMHIRSSRNLSPGWCVTHGLGSSMRYGLQAEGRGPKSRYHGFFADDCSDSPVTRSHPLVRRDRSFSPFKRRDCHEHQSRTQSSSRSRHHSSSHGNPCFRWRSKSPKFRSAIRTQRMRYPNQRPGLLVDSGAGPAARNHGSPPQKTQWIGDRKDFAVDFWDQSYKQSSFLGRRSMRRFVQQADRVDLVDSPPCFRSMHQRRSMDMGEAGGEVLRCEENDDNRGKHRYRCGLAHPMKRYAIDRPVKRFRYNAADGYDSRYSEISDFSGRGSPKCRDRGIDSQIGNVPRNLREDRGSFTYPREGKYNVDLKSFGVQRGDDDTASRRRT